jgi:hypothetical protein
MAQSFSTGSIVKLFYAYYRTLSMDKQGYQ